MKEDSVFARPDPKLVAKLTELVATHHLHIDEVISGYLASGWTIERLNITMRAIIRTAVGELMYFPDIPAKVIINEYTSITRSFFSVTEIGFVNSILERIAMKLRPQEMEKNTL